MDKNNFTPDAEDSNENIMSGMRIVSAGKCKHSYVSSTRKKNKIREIDYSGSVGTLYDSYDVLFGAHDKGTDKYVPAPENELPTNRKLYSSESDIEPSIANNTIAKNFLKTSGSYRTIIPVNSGNSDESERSYNKEIKDLEDSRSVPFYKKMKQLKKCFSQNTLADLIAIGIDIYDDEAVEDIPQPTDEFKPSGKPCPSDTDSEERPSTPPNRVRRPNPYLNFMRKPEKEAKIWRPAPKPNFEELHLLEKTDLLFKNIINEFYDWFTEISSENQEYDRDTIQELFQIPCPYPIARAIDNNMKLLGCVPDSIAKNTGAPEFSAKLRLHEEMARDAKAASLPPRTVAFNKTLPPHLRHKPLKDHFIKRIEEPEKLQQDVTTMAYVWKDISQLYITKAYAMWLNSHADLKVPQYLIDEGILDKKITKMPIVDVEKLNKLKNSQIYENILQEAPK